ncbi:hypothetical protein [Endozoicomonas sp. ISHI1]|uniref:hypothetical protein n=1 Tax=Endozoicomonas sp. ISHI1 TaxID=2825882 RepID=UPI0021497333|nr:hypothetical protein [Endozoicomonas sp. ISHI1]
MRYVILLLMLVAGLAYVEDFNLELSQSKQVAETVYPFPACSYPEKHFSQDSEKFSITYSRCLSESTSSAQGFRPLPMEYG